MKTALVWSVSVASFLAVVVTVALFGCAPKAAPVSVVSGSSKSSPAPASDPNVKTLTPHPVTTDKEFLTDEAKRKANADKPLDKELDPAVFGEYRMQLSGEQKTQIDGAIAQMKKDVAAGKQGAEAALQMAMAAKELADRLVVNLKPNGRYSADLGDGDSGGTFRTGKDVVLLKPDVLPKDPKEPKDVEMAFDKVNKTLTVDFQGSKMLFVRK